MRALARSATTNPDAQIRMYGRCRGVSTGVRGPRCRKPGEVDDDADPLEQAAVPSTGTEALRACLAGRGLDLAHRAGAFRSLKVLALRDA